MACDTDTLLASACELGYNGLSDRKLREALLVALCNITGGGGGGGVETGIGSPEGVVVAAVGTLYLDLTDTDNPDLWAKTTGAGNTGWAALVI